MSYSRDSLNDLLFNSATGEYENANKPERLYGWNNISAVAQDVLYTATAVPASGDDIYNRYGNKINKKVDRVFGNGISFKVALEEKKVDIDNFNYTTDDDKVVLTKYVGTGIADVVIPNLEDK